MKYLFLIPARGGSKGIPKKNIRVLGSKPLIHYSINIAKLLSPSIEDICISTDSEEIKEVVEATGVKVQFIRPAQLATDSANSRDVILHALDYFEKRNRFYDAVVLLQPTSPFRRVMDVKTMIELYTSELDMVVSVKEAHDNPYFSLFEENGEHFLELSKKGDFTRRQDAPKVYAYNGSVYIINPQSVKNKPLSHFNKVRKYEMEDLYSVDIDKPLDWLVAETIISNNLLESESE